MKIQVPHNLEDSLNGGFRGLYGEVVTEDCYHVKKLDFVPALIFDIGANVGVFSRFARQLFPHARIVALEPHPENIAVFKEFTFDQNLVLVEKALGMPGKVYRIHGARNGAGEHYHSATLGYPEEDMSKEPTYERTEASTITLAELVHAFWTPEAKTLMKIDCEGAENCIWLHPPSMDALRLMDYIALELHFFSFHGGYGQTVISVTNAALTSLERTHLRSQEHIYVWMRKRV